MNIPLSGRKMIYWVEGRDADDIRQRLRISVTDGCNFNCFFCHNEGQGPVSLNTGYMNVEEITKIVEIAVRSGVKHVKVTGGEPLIYRHGGENVVDLISSIDALRKRGFEFSLSMVTNGYLLSEYAESLKQAGLDRVTVSLITLNPVLLNQYIYKGSVSAIDKVIDGIRAAIRANLKPVKINTVVFFDRKRRAGNLDEIPQIVRKCVDLGVEELRLYVLLWHSNFDDFSNYYCYWDDEMFTLNFLDECGNLQSYAEAKENVKNALLASLRTFAQKWAEIEYPKSRLVIKCDNLSIAFEPMRYGRFADSECGDEGPYAIRVSSRGEIHPCLLSNQSVDFLQALRSGATDAELLALFRQGQDLLP